MLMMTFKIFRPTLLKADDFLFTFVVLTIAIKRPIKKPIKVPTTAIIIVLIVPSTKRGPYSFNKNPIHPKKLLGIFISYTYSPSGWLTTASSIMLCLSSSEIFERAWFTWSRSSVFPFLTPTAIDVSSTEV